jgi:hypothetical protein
MVMQANIRLAQLLQLADRGPAMRAALAEELAELLCDWPGDCPTQMRQACESLLARAALEVDGAVRARLRTRLALYPELAARVLPAKDIHHGVTEAARCEGEIPAALMRALGLPQLRIKAILSDHSGQALAAACKGLRLPRATFSALVVLMSAKSPSAKILARLDAYDAITVAEAAQMLEKWRDHDRTERAA